MSLVPGTELIKQTYKQTNKQTKHQSAKSILVLRYSVFDSTSYHKAPEVLVIFWVIGVSFVQEVTLDRLQEEV